MVESIAELRRICQSIDKKKGKLPFSVVLARRISIYFTKLLLYTKITANQVTLLCIVIGVSASLFFAVGNPWLILAGALLLELYYVFDHVDGEVARYRCTSSITGIYLDFIGHYVVHPAIFICLAYGAYYLSSNVLFLILGYLSSLSIILIDLTRDCLYKTAFLTVTSPEYESTDVKRSDFGINIDNENRVLKEQQGDSHFNLLQASKFFVSMFRIPFIIHILFIVSGLNLVFQEIVIGNISFNLIQIVLIVYCVISPLIWMGLIVFYKKTNLAEELLRSLVEKTKSG